MKIPKQTGKLIFPQLGAGSACGLGLGETEMPGQEGSYHNSPCRRGCARRAANACGKTTREQLSNFETTAVCKLHTAVAKVNIQFQQISFSPTWLLVGALRVAAAATVIIGDKCLHHFCCPRDDEASTPFLLHAVRDAAAC